MQTAVPASRRRALAVRHLPLVKALTRRTASRLPAHLFDPQDLFGVGTIGLMEAGWCYDPSHGLTFGQFAKTVIRRHLAGHIRVGTAANRQYRRDRRAGRVPLDATEIPIAAAAFVIDQAPSPERLCLRAEQALMIRGAVDELPPRLRDAIRRYYFGDRQPPPLAGAPKATGLHREALAQLRVILEERGLTAELL